MCRSALSIAVPDAMKGEVIEAFVVVKAPVENEAALADELKQRVRDNLAAYAYPRSVMFVDLLPKTPSRQDPALRAPRAAPHRARSLRRWLTVTSSSSAKPTASAR